MSGLSALHCYCVREAWINPSQNMADVRKDDLTIRDNSGRCIAVDVRPRSFGFVAVEGVAVLDCGTRACGLSRSSECLGQRFQRILKTYAPLAVIIRTYRPSRIAGKDRRMSLAAALRAVARESKVAIVDMRPNAVRRFFRSRHARTKDEIARAVATLLPELAWKLPPRGKIWQGEHFRMSIFDAAAGALTYLGSQPNPAAPADPM